MTGLHLPPCRSRLTYDSQVPPLSARTGDNTSLSGPSRAGADIALQIRFFKVKEVNVGKRSTAANPICAIRRHGRRVSLRWPGVAHGPKAFDSRPTLAEGFMTLKIWWRLVWTDERLSWVPSEHNNITQVPLGSNEIWKPDLQPYNAQDGIESTLDDSNLMVSSSGSIFWSRPGSA